MKVETYREITRRLVLVGLAVWSDVE